MTIYAETTVDLYNRLPLTIITAKQGDTGRGAIVTVTAGDSLPDFSGATVTMYIKKPDGTKVYNACTVVDNVITCDFTNQALAVPGDNQMELQAIDGADILTTPIFILRVLPSNVDGTAIQSQDEFTALETALNTLSTYNAIHELPLNSAPNVVSSLADAFDAQSNHRIAYFRASNSTTDKAPGAANQGVLSYRYYGAGAYGAQLSFSAQGLYVRFCSNGTWGAWSKLATV